MCQLIALVCLWVAAIFGVYKSILSCLGIAFFFLNVCIYACHTRSSVQLCWKITVCNFCYFCDIFV